jgi:hypothetical protein
MKTILAICLITMAHLAFAMAGYLDYQIWSQVEYLSQIPFYDFTSAGTLLHAPRLLAVMPSYLLAEWWDMDSNAIYSLYVVLLAGATSWVWVIIQNRFVVKSRHRNYLWITPFVLLHFINGRFAFALFGLSLLLLVIILIKLRMVRFSSALTLLFLTMLYSSVSSGVFSVACVLLLLELRREIKNLLESETIFKYILKSSTLFAFMSSLLYFLYFFLLKNIDFYGGGIDGLLGMISHGFGLFFNPEPVLEYCASSMNTACAISVTLVTSNFAQIIAIIVLPVLIIILGAILYTSDFSPMAKRILAVSAVGGVFGFTTLMCFIVSMPILVRKKLVFPSLRG